MKTLTLTLLGHARLFWCFNNPPNSNVDCRIFNVRMWTCWCMRIYTWVIKYIFISRKLVSAFLLTLGSWYLCLFLYLRVHLNFHQSCLLQPVWACFSYRERERERERDRDRERQRETERERACNCVCNVLFVVVVVGGGGVVVVVVLLLFFFSSFFETCIDIYWEFHMLRK